jgi:two-component system OmpR family response regulator
MKVLLVEDEAPLADVLARNLRAHGHTVTTEGSAESAILDMAEQWPDALVLDVNLPDYSGWEVLRRIGGARRGMRVVIISAAPISQKRIAEFRPDHCLLKPFPSGTLLRALEPASTENTRNEDTSPQS